MVTCFRDVYQDGWFTLWILQQVSVEYKGLVLLVSTELWEIALTTNFVLNKWMFSVLLIAHVVFLKETCSSLGTGSCCGWCVVGSIQWGAQWFSFQMCSIPLGEAAVLWGGGHSWSCSGKGFGDRGCRGRGFLGGYRQLGCFPGCPKSRVGNLP